MADSYPPWALLVQYIPRNMHTVFALLCFVVVIHWLVFFSYPSGLLYWHCGNLTNDCPSASKATLMNMDKYFMWIHYERLLSHNKAKYNKTVCIFLGIYCILWTLACFICGESTWAMLHPVNGISSIPENKLIIMRIHAYVFHSSFYIYCSYLNSVLVIFSACLIHIWFLYGYSAMNCICCTCVPCCIFAYVFPFEMWIFILWSFNITLEKLRPSLLNWSCLTSY